MGLCAVVMAGVEVFGESMNCSSVGCRLTGHVGTPSSLSGHLVNTKRCHLLVLFAVNYFVILLSRQTKESGADC